MAVFMINICKYNGCGITFPTLGDLIQHIEDTHIDYDPIVVEQKEASQPSCIPLSYVLRFFTEATRRELQSLPPAPEARRRVPSQPKPPSVRSSTPTGSEFDEEDMLSQSEDSNDSWTTVEEYSSEFILRYGVRQNNASVAAAGAGAPPQEKPFACPVPGCKKRYKNINGIKYHSKNGHKKDGKVKKAYKCHCGKSYKSGLGLKNHSISQHIAAHTHAGLLSSALEGKPKNSPGLIVTASQPRHLQPLDADASKLVRIYDSLKPRDIPALTIPKLKEGSGRAAAAALLTPASTPGSSPVEKKFERPKVTVQSQPAAAPSHGSELYVTKVSN